jgi:hypothetical protein
VVREVVPYSDENAETLATAIQARCDHRYDLRKSAAIVLYGASDQVRTALATEREKDRRALLAQIVTFRAELKNEGLRNEQPRSPPGVAAKAF